VKIPKKIGIFGNFFKSKIEKQMLRNWINSPKRTKIKIKINK
jgi:hypothetical protein